MGIRNCASSDVGGRRDRTEAKHNGHRYRRGIEQGSRRDKEAEEGLPSCKKRTSCKESEPRQGDCQGSRWLGPLREENRRALEDREGQACPQVPKKNLGTHIRGKAKREEIA